MERAKAGETAMELAEYYGVNKATIYRTLHKLGFYYYEVDEEAIIAAVKAGEKQEDISHIED